MSTKKTWIRARANQLQQNAAGGDNDLPSISTSIQFDEFTTLSGGVKVATFARDGELVLLEISREAGDTRLKAVRTDKSLVFEEVHSSKALTFVAVAERRGWIICTRSVSGVYYTSVFSAGSGLLIGEVAVRADSCWESEEGRLVIAEQVPVAYGVDYDFHELSLNAQRALTSTYLWTEDTPPTAYHPATDNLLFAVSGKCRELLTGTEVWNFPVTDFEDGLRAPHGTLVDTAFDEEGRAYNLQLQQTRIGNRMEERPVLRRLSFPPKTGSPQAALLNWSVDLSQSFPGTNNPYALWGAFLESTYVNLNPVGTPDDVEFTNYITPYWLSVTDGVVWLVMAQMEFAYTGGQGGSCFYSGTRPPGMPDCPSGAGPGADIYYMFPAVLQLNPTNGNLLHQRDFGAMTLETTTDDDFNPVLLAANSSAGSWAIVNFVAEVGEGPVTGDPLYNSILVTIRGATETGPPTLVYEDPMDEGPQSVTTTVLPHGELREAIIGGGAIFYPHVEEDGYKSVRKMGDGVFPDTLGRLCRYCRCEPEGTVNVFGINRQCPPGYVEFSAHSKDNASASLGSGWGMAAFKKVTEGLDGQLEYRNGAHDYEKWNLVNGQYVPVHGDNYVVPVKNQDGTFQLTFPDYSKMNFDTNGKVTTEEDRSGNVTTYTYETVSPGEEAHARLESISDGFGRVTEFSYASSEFSDRQPTEITIKEQGGTNHRVIEYEYDSVTDALVKVTQPNGDETEYVYYPDGNIHKVIEPGGRVALTYTYYPDGKVETETSYISVEFPNGTMKREYSYDVGNNKTTITTKDMQTSEPDRVMTYTYDQLYNIIKMEDAIGNVTRHEYNDTNNPYLRTKTIAPNLTETTWAYNSLGNLTQTTDAQGNVTNFEYAEDIGPVGDQYKHLIRKVIRPKLDGQLEVDRHTTEFQYDTLGRVDTIIDADGNSATVTYLDVVGKPKGLISKTTDRRGNDTDFTYLTNGNLDKVEVETGRSTGVIKTEFEYDGFDSVTKVTNDNSEHVDTVYDTVGRATSVTDARGKVSSFRYVDGLLDEMDLPANTASGGTVRTTTMTYDAAARVTKVERDISGSAQEMRVKYAYDGLSQLQALTRIKNGTEKSFTFDYDKLGRATSATDPLSKTSTTSYEPYCTGSAQTSARGIRRRSRFDTLCRMTELEVGDAGTDPLEVDNPRELRSFDYDELGRLIQTDQGLPPVFGTAKYGTAKYGTPLVGADSGVRTYEYDKLDRLTKLTFEDLTTMLYEYDAEGNVTKMTDPNGNVTDYEYYADNLLHKAIIKRSGQSDRVFVYDYDAVGRPKSIIYPTSAGITAFFNSATGLTDGWNANGQLLNLRYEKGGANIRSFEYAYDDSGNRTQAVEVVGAVTNTWDYEYDWLDRLEKVKKNTVTQSIYAYDASDNRTSLNLAALGNILTYTYDDADNITEVKKDSVSIETFTKDDDGNMLTRLDTSVTPNITTTYEWDDFDKLIKVSESDGTTTTVKHQSLYNVNGMRRRKTDAASVTTTEYAEGLSTAVAKAGSASITYIRAHGIAGFDDGTNFYYFLTDALGSVRSIVNASGVVQTSYDFDEYGNLISTPPTGVTSQKTFVGSASVQDETGDTGLYLMGHRWMDPTLGRFINRDPIGFDGGYNLFSYAGSSPIGTTDPIGLENPKPGTQRPPSRIKPNRPPRGPNPSLPSGPTGPARVLKGGGKVIVGVGMMMSDSHLPGPMDPPGAAMVGSGVKDIVVGSFETMLSSYLPPTDAPCEGKEDDDNDDLIFTWRNKKWRGDRAHFLPSLHDRVGIGAQEFQEDWLDGGYSRRAGGGHSGRELWHINRGKRGRSIELVVEPVPRIVRGVPVSGSFITARRFTR